MEESWHCDEVGSAMHAKGADLVVESCQRCWDRWVGAGSAEPWEGLLRAVHGVAAATEVGRVFEDCIIVLKGRGRSERLCAFFVQAVMLWVRRAIPCLMDMLFVMPCFERVSA